MKNNKTKDLTLSVKLKRIREEFPELPISRSTVWKVNNIDINNFYRCKENISNTVLRKYRNTSQKDLEIRSWEELLISKSFYSIWNRKEQ